MGESSSSGSGGSTSGGTTSGGTTSGSSGGSTSGGSSGTGGTTGAPTCPGGGIGPGDHTIELMHGGLDRSFIVHVPPAYDGLEPVSLVLNFHGLTSNAGQQVFFSEMNDTADKEGFVVVYPEGIQSSWNAGECCGGAQSMGLDDVGFARAVVEAVEGVVCVDPRRVYATGMSNGGFMTNRLACEASDLFAAFAPVSAVLVLEPCENERPAPIMMFNGTADVLVSYEGGLFMGAEATFAGWAGRDGCVGDPVETFKNGAATCLTYDQCEGDAEVTLCTIEGMNHCWPGNDFCPLPPANTDISANDAMWAFFQAHPLP